MLTSTNELRNELVDIENYIYFENIKMNVKDIKCSLEWWKKH
jgi:hypothetical protein